MSGRRSAPSLPIQINFLAERESTRYNSFYGLWRSFMDLDHSCWSCHRCDRETADAGKRSRRLHHHDSARHRRRVRWDVDRSRLCGRELRRRLDHVGHRRHGSVAAVSIPFQTRRVAGSGGLLVPPVLMLEHRPFHCRLRRTSAACSTTNARVCSARRTRHCHSSWPRRKERSLSSHSPRCT